MHVGAAFKRKGIILPQLFRRIVQALDKTFIQQLARQFRKSDIRLSPAEGGLERRIACEAAFFSRSAGKHGVQAMA